MSWFPHLAVLHAAATLVMTGVIWTVQFVHYPLFARVGSGHFVDYEREHCRRIARVVLPCMLAELALAAALPFAARVDSERALAWVGAGLLAAVWAATFLLAVPCHRVLSRGWDAAAARRLVATNRVRTAAWTLRAVVAVALLWPASP